MKTFKKALSIILGAAMILSCVAGMQISASAEGNTLDLKVGTATVDNGVVTVPVVVDANTGFQALTVPVSYDDAVLDLVSAEKNAKFAGDLGDSAVVGPTDANPFKMMWAYALTTENVTATGTIATLTFNVVEGATAESTDITLNVTEAWDVAKDDVVATATAGTVDLVKEPVGPVVDSTLNAQGTSLGFGTSSLQLTFRYMQNNLNKYYDVELVIVPEKYDTLTFNLVETPEEIVIPKEKLNVIGNVFYTYIYEDIQLYELGLDIDYYVRAYDDDGDNVADYVSDVVSVSPAGSLKELYATLSANAETNAKLLTVITDTLIVGDEAAKYFGKVGSDLANADSIIDEFDTSRATSEIATVNDTDIHNATNSNFGTVSSCANWVFKSAAIGKAPYFSYRIKTGGIDINKLSFTVSYTQTTGMGTTGTYTKTFTSADTDNLYAAGTAFIMFKFDEVGLADGDADIDIVANYDGAEVFNAKYSLETYLGSNLDNESLGAISSALVKLGISCSAYFA